MGTAVGILGVGTYLPEVVRKNDWWPASIVAKWEEKLAVKKERRSAEGAAPELPPGAAEVIAALARYADDPFKGGLERRVMSNDMLPSDMEVAAGKNALERAGVRPSEIDLLLVFSQLPDYIAVPTAPIVHKQLGLRADCLSTSTDSACNSFLVQLAIAEQMIAAGGVKKALLIQSSAAQHLIRPEDQHSAWFGDGATAVVVGRVGQGRGILGSAHRTDGSLYRALVGGCPSGGRWFDGGQLAYYFADREASVKLALLLPSLGKTVIDEALKRAGADAGDVDFYASHQGTVWFREVTQRHLGLAHARHFDSYAWTTSLAASNIPFVLAMAEKEGLLRAGDLVAMYSGGSGITVSGTILRWGT